MGTILVHHINVSVMFIFPNIVLCSCKISVIPKKLMFASVFQRISGGFWIDSSSVVVCNIITLQYTYNFEIPDDIIFGF